MNKQKINRKERKLLIIKVTEEEINKPSYYILNKDKVKCFSKVKIKKMIDFNNMVIQKREKYKNGITLTFD
jgi:hypothetical protein